MKGTKGKKEGDLVEGRETEIVSATVVGLNEMHLSEVEPRDVPREEETRPSLLPLSPPPLSFFVPESPRRPEKAGERNMVK